MIYMDHAATTMLLPQAAQYMKQFEQKEYANPSGNYPFARKAKEAIADARDIIARTIGAKADEIYFTSGGSEADNWALKGIAAICKRKHPHMITTKIEHPAILNTCHYLEKQGCLITYLDVSKDGMIDLNQLKSALQRETVLVSVMTANNEIGTIQPIEKIAQIAHSNGALFHTDAVQAYGHLPISVKKMGIDLMSASAHKLNGPKGIGFLYVREGIPMDSYIHGGAQEMHRRAGTENVAGIAGFGVAAAYADTHRKQLEEKEHTLRDYIINRLQLEFPNVQINGSLEQRLSNNINCTFHGVNGESILALMALDNICISVGSACHSSSPTPSHVLLAIGLSEEEAHSTLRITIGSENTKAEADYVIAKLKEAVHKLA